MKKIGPRISNNNYRSSYAMPDQPWWENLDVNFNGRSDKFEMDLGTRMLVRSTAMSDVGLRTLGASLLAAASIPSTFSPFKTERDNREAAFYKALADDSHAESFFQRPTERVEIRESDSSWYHFQPKDGECKMLAFDSPFRTVNESVALRYQKHTRNRIARAQHWRHNGGPRPTVCVIHGFMADAYWVNSKFLDLKRFYNAGYDVLLYTLPFHGKRQDKYSPFSGHGYFSGGVSQLNEAIANSVFDFRIFLDYLETIGVAQFGVTGISLGGYTSAILAAVEDRLAFSIPIVPVVSIADLLLHWVPASWVARGLMKYNDLDLFETRHRMAVHCPLTYRSKLPNERLMIIAGAGDRLAPPKHARLLWGHWGECRMHWFPGSHAIHVEQEKYLDEMIEFMKRLEF